MDTDVECEDSYRFPELDYVDCSYLQELYNLHGRERVLGWLRAKVAIPLRYQFNDDFDEDEYWDEAVDHYVETNDGRGKERPGTNQ